MKPGILYFIAEHSAWCPMAYGEGRRCCCHPTMRQLAEGEFTQRVAQDFRNRAQRRADARRSAKGDRHA